MKKMILLLLAAVALAAGTLFIGSALFYNFHSWTSSLSKEQLKLVTNVALTVAGLFSCIGVYLRFRRGPSGCEL